MTGPGPGEEPYTGPPPTLRPGPGQWQPVYGPPAPWQWAPGWPPPSPWQQPPVAWQQPPSPWQQPPPPGVRWAPPPGTPPHDVPQSFLLVMRTRTWAWWRPLAGLLLFVVVYLVLLAATAVAGMLSLVASGVDLEALPDLEVVEFTDPWALLLMNTSLIVAIPCVWIVWVALHGMRIGWSSSVLGRFRWRLVPPYVLTALAVLGTGIGLSVLIGFLVGGEDVTGPVPSFGWLLVVVLLTTPLQSAAEEYFFRGYLSQAIGGWIRHPVAGRLFAAVLTALVFAAMHGEQDLPAFLDRFAFGLTASAVVWLTGGLEAAIVFHSVNNVLVFVLAGALGAGVATDEAPQGTGGLYLLISLLAMAAYVLLVARSRGSLRPEIRTAAQDMRLMAGPVPAAAG
jgi:membrane protease YdiL (CAAX protease family)